MVLETYETFDDKSKYFYHEKIETFDQFETFYEGLSNNKKLIYRGVSDASYKLYNTLQIHFIEHELNLDFDNYHEFIKTHIESAKRWNNNLLIKFYKSLGHNSAYDLSVLSFLRHSGSPAPLLDWSYNFNISLFFSCKQYSNSAKNETEDYCSLYVFDLDANNELSNLPDVYHSINESFISASKSKPEVDGTELQNKIDKHSYSLIKELPIAYISDENSDVNFPLYTNANLNIINQEGLFIFNNSPNIPLEQILNGDRKDHISMSAIKIRCIDIHKSLVNGIIKKLETKGIKKDYVYPKPENIKDYLLNKSIC